MVGNLQLANPHPLTGDGLRDLAGDLLASRYGTPKREKRANGKKVDLYFEFSELGKTRRIFVESKDYTTPLTRKQVVYICSDYAGIVNGSIPSDLLIVTRNGLTADAQAYVDEETRFARHLTIWELESDVIGLFPYVEYVKSLFDDRKLSSYYIDARADTVRYLSDNTRLTNSNRLELFGEIKKWLNDTSNRPIAILGGYGAGKTSFAYRLAHWVATEAQTDPRNRRPIVVKLGHFSKFSTIEGILGAMFSAEFPVRGFNFHQFMTMNEAGRFVIMLDGFDEMKHAMTWPDFRSQIAELNRFNVGSSKVLLLGRPTAFLSDDEHFHVLRGMKKLAGSWRKLPDWPEFLEYDLAPFNRDELSIFIGKFLRSQLSDKYGNESQKEEIDNRIKTVQILADREFALFSKPVHAKILTELAADQSFDLSIFTRDATGTRRTTRWNLYQAFFQSIIERESDKSVRRPISEESRFKFLRKLATWLWTERAGSLAFSVGDLSENFISGIPGVEDMDFEVAIRELLTGAAIEKKHGDVYFFGHRSFMEYLVADEVSRKKGATWDPKHIREGVGDFLRDRGTNDLIAGWIKSLAKNRGNVEVSYLKFLAAAAGGLPALVSRIDSTSVWHHLLLDFDRDFNLGPLEESKLLKRMAKHDNVLFALGLKVINWAIANRQIDFEGIDSSVMEQLAWSLLDHASRPSFDEFGFLHGHPELVDYRYFSGAVSKDPRGSRIQINCTLLMAKAAHLLSVAGVDITFPDEDPRYRTIGFPKQVDVYHDAFESRMTLLNRRRIKRSMEKVAIVEEGILPPAT